MARNFARLWQNHAVDDGYIALKKRAGQRHRLGLGWLLLCWLMYSTLGMAQTFNPDNLLTDEEQRWLNAHPQIVLGISDKFLPAIVMLPDGEYSGLIVDYIQLLNQQLGDRIRLHIEQDWSTLTQKAIDRTVDGLAPSMPNPTWDQHFLYTEPLYHIQFYFYTRVGQPAIDSRSALAGLRVGYLQGIMRLEHLLAEMPEVTRVPLTSHAAMVDALLTGEVDTLVSSIDLEWWRRQHTNIAFRMTGILEYNRHPIVLSIRKDWPLLVSILNKTMRQVSAIERERIDRRWLGDFSVPPMLSTQDFMLSPVQHDWLRAHSVIRYTQDPKRAPVEFVDAAGIPRGMSADYLQRVAELLGVYLEFVPVSSWSEALEKIQSHEIDLLPTVVATEERQAYLNFTQPYIHIPVAIFAPLNAPFYGSLDALAGRQVAVLQDAAIQEWLARDYPDIRQRAFRDQRAALRAVQRGQVDALVDDLITTSYLISRDGLNTIRMAGNTPYSFDLRMGVRQDWTALADILDQVLMAIPQFEHNTIQNRWLQMPVPEAIDYRLVWQVIGAALLILLIMLYWNRRLAITRTALKRSEGYYRALISSMGEGVIVHGVDGRIITCNKAAEQILGTNREQLLGLKILDAYWQVTDEQGNPVSRDHCPALVTLRTGEPQSGVTTGVQMPNGQQRWLLVNTQPLYLDDSQIPGSVIATFTDITERLHLEQKLQHTAREAEAANHAKSTFLANMSHEIRTPMNAVLGMLYLVLETTLNERQRGYIQQAQRAAQSLLGLLNDILDFSKVEAGHIKLEQTSFSLSGVLADVETVVSRQAKDKGLIFNVLSADDIPNALLGDPLRLAQVLINLTNNAIKFTERGYVNLSVRLEQRHTDSVRLHFAVRDTGIGMDQQQFATLFQPFQQMDASITRRYGGTGLGLSISKRLVELMGSTIHVVSRPNAGSVFSFTLTFAVVATDSTQNTLVHSATQAATNLAGRRALLVEDNLINREMVRASLESAGMMVTLAEHGMAALAQIETAGLEAWDVILMDVQMPELDGLETTRQIRARPDGAHVPIIGLSAHAHADNIHDSLTAGMNTHLVKPIDPPRLFIEIAQQLATSVATPAAQDHARDLANHEQEQPLPAPSALTEPAYAAISAQLKHLHTLASTCDTSLEDYFLAQRPQLMTVLPAAEIAALARLINRYEFQQAAILLDQWRSRLYTVNDAAIAQ